MCHRFNRRSHLKFHRFFALNRTLAVKILTFRYFIQCFFFFNFAQFLTMQFCVSFPKIRKLLFCCWNYFLFSLDSIENYSDVSNGFKFSRWIIWRMHEHKKKKIEQCTYRVDPYTLSIQSSHYHCNWYHTESCAREIEMRYLFVVRSKWSLYCLCLNRSIRLWWIYVNFS